MDITKALAIGWQDSLVAILVSLLAISALFCIYLLLRIKKYRAQLRNAIESKGESRPRRFHQPLISSENAEATAGLKSYEPLRPGITMSYRSNGPPEIGHSSDDKANLSDQQFLNRMMSILESHIGNDKFTTEEFSEEIGISRSHLHRKLKALTGQGPNEFIRSHRLNRAHEMLRRNFGTTAEIAYAVGFGSPSYFTKCFHEKFGYTPSEIIDH